MTRRLKLAISPCPNDTFAFHALLHGPMAERFDVTLDDVEALNRAAARGELDVAKISVAAYGHLRDRYALLHAGGAAGFGVGPIVVAREPRAVGGRVAIPGEHTTAALLLRLLGRFETVALRFDRIEQAVLDGDADCGVLIHEGRFTFAAKGLARIADLGEAWEARMTCPLPLGAIAIRRALGEETAREIDAAIRASVDAAFADPDASRAFVREHAREMDPDVVRRHIDLYVNDYTRRLDPSAVRRLLGFGAEQGLFPASDAPIFAWHPA